MKSKHWLRSLRKPAVAKLNVSHNYKIYAISRRAIIYNVFFSTKTQQLLYILRNIVKHSRYFLSVWTEKLLRSISASANEPNHSVRPPILKDIYMCAIAPWPIYHPLALETKAKSFYSHLIRTNNCLNKPKKKKKKSKWLGEWPQCRCPIPLSHC